VPWWETIPWWVVREAVGEVVRGWGGRRCLGGRDRGGS
jgi:hypothetical protein